MYCWYADNLTRETSIDLLEYFSYNYITMPDNSKDAINDNEFMRAVGCAGVLILFIGTTGVITYLAIV